MLEIIQYPVQYEPYLDRQYDLPLVLAKFVLGHAGVPAGVARVQEADGERRPRGDARALQALAGGDSDGAGRDGGRRRREAPLSAR